MHASIVACMHWRRSRTVSSALRAWRPSSSFSMPPSLARRMVSAPSTCAGVCVCVCDVGACDSRWHLLLHATAPAALLQPHCRPRERGGQTRLRTPCHQADGRAGLTGRRWTTRPAGCTRQAWRRAAQSAAAVRGRRRRRASLGQRCCHTQFTARPSHVMPNMGGRPVAAAVKVDLLD